MIKLLKGVKKWNVYNNLWINFLLCFVALLCGLES